MNIERNYADDDVIGKQGVYYQVSYFDGFGVISTLKMVLMGKDPNTLTCSPKKPTRVPLRRNIS